MRATVDQLILLTAPIYVYKAFGSFQMNSRNSLATDSVSIGVSSQEWVTASDLIISLDRINTFGDEFFKDAKVLRSYFYAISDFSVGGR